MRRIVKTCGVDGDRALRRYAERWDGLGRGQSLRVSEQRNGRPHEGMIAPQLRKSLAGGGTEYPAISANGRSRRSGRGRGVGFLLGKLYVRLSRWDVTCPADAIRWSQLC